MKIIQTSQRFYPACGGLENHVLEISKRIAKFYSNIDVYTSDYISADKKTTNKFSKLNKINIYRHYALKYGYNFVYFMPKLPYNLKKSNFDILHAHGYGYFQCDAAYFTKLTTKKPLIITPHYHPPVSTFRKIYDKNLGKRVLNKANAIITLTDHEKKILQKFNLSNKKIVRIPNGININKLKTSSDLDKLKLKFGLMNKKIILTVGRLEKRKRYEMLLKVFKDLTYYYDKIKLIIVGPNFGMKRKLKNLAARLNIIDKILFLGYIDTKDLHGLYQIADVFLLTSLYEAWSIVALESQYYGTIPVVSNCGGIKECVLDKKTGFLVDKNSQNQYLDATKKVLSNSDEIKKMRINSKKWANMFGWDVIVKYIIRLYKRVLRGHNFENCSYYPKLLT